MTKRRRSGSAPLRTRAEKKELARLRREQELKRDRRARFIRTFITLAIISGLLWAAIAWFTRPDESAPPTSLGGHPPAGSRWFANPAQPAARLEGLRLR